MGHTQNKGMKSQPKAVAGAHLREVEQTPETKKQQLGAFLTSGLIRALGLAVLIVSFGAYFQLVPLTLVFVGGYLGVQPEASFSDMDTLIWLMSGAAFLVPMVWVFIRWVRYVWGRFIVNPLSLYPSRLLK